MTEFRNILKAKLPEHLRPLIFKRFLSIVLPIVFVLIVPLLVHSLFLPASQQMRIIPSALGLAALVVSFVLYKKERVVAAGLVVLGAGTAAVVSAMIVSGGMAAPAFYGVIPMAVVFCVLYGSRVGLIATFVAVVLSLVFSMLVGNHILSVPDEPPIFFRFVVHTLWMLFVMVAVVILINMLYEALAQSNAERQNAQRLRLRSEAAFHQSFQLMALLDAAGKVVVANNTALEFIGKTNDDVLGQPFEQTPWWPESERPRLREAIVAAKLGGRVSFETHHFNKEGERRLFDVAVGPFRDNQGEIVYLIVEGRDVTELVSAKEMLSQREKMDSVGELAGGIAHDFNNMLGGIMGAAEILSTYACEQDERFTRVMNILMTSTERASALTEKLLVFSRKKSGERSAASFHEIISETVSLLSHTIDKRISVETDLKAASDVVFADVAQMQNVVLNLGINARDAMPGGGTLTITSQNVILDETSGKAGTFDLSPGEYLKVSVRDTGVGIDKLTQRRIFEPFFTTKGPGKGTGLGLATAYGTLLAHQGAIQVYSDPGQGTVFHLLLPIHEGVIEPEEERPSGVFSDEGTVLVIDDEEVVLAATEMMLSSLGYSVIRALDGEEGALLYERHSKQIKFVLLDMIMPRMNGVETFGRLREINPDVKIILATGYAHAESVHALMDKGLNGFIEKPFRRKDLVRAIERAFGA